MNVDDATDWADALCSGLELETFAAQAGALSDLLPEFLQAQGPDQ